MGGVGGAAIGVVVDEVLLGKKTGEQKAKDAQESASGNCHLQRERQYGMTPSARCLGRSGHFTIQREDIDFVVNERDIYRVVIKAGQSVKIVNLNEDVNWQRLFNDWVSGQYTAEDSEYLQGANVGVGIRDFFHWVARDGNIGAGRDDACRMASDAGYAERWTVRLEKLRGKKRQIVEDWLLSEGAPLREAVVSNLKRFLPKAALNIGIGMMLSIGASYLLVWKAIELSDKSYAHILTIAVIVCVFVLNAAWLYNALVRREAYRTLKNLTKR